MKIGTKHENKFGLQYTVIHENQKGFLFKNGKYMKTVPAGKYMLFGGRTVEPSMLDEPIFSETCALETLLHDPDVAAHTTVTEVGDRQLVLHFMDGRYRDALARQGKYAYWTDMHEHTFQTVNISQPEIGDEVPRYILTQLPPMLYTRVEVPEYMKARLYYDKQLVRVLDAGTYFFWKADTKVEADLVDMRLTQMNITGQEMMTQDKVALRINFVCSYRITDCVKILTEIDDYEEQMHVTAQLALREYVSKYNLDDLLANKDEISNYVLGRLKEKESELYVEIKDAGVKDMILPGEIRDIMNTVLMAEKKAQAGVITRREEVASTRSLLNTAKLMDENKTLYKLKELEYVERICENVGSITLNGSGNMLSQLLEALGNKEK